MANTYCENYVRFGENYTSVPSFRLIIINISSTLKQAKENFYVSYQKTLH